MAFTIGIEPAASGAAEARRGERTVFLDETGELTSIAVYDGLRLSAGHHLEGPAVVEYPDTTLVIRPGQRAHWDEYLSAVVEA